jgi:hypothetical protein
VRTDSLAVAIQPAGISQLRQAEPQPDGGFIPNNPAPPRTDTPNYLRSNSYANNTILEGQIYSTRNLSLRQGIFGLISARVGHLLF